MGTDAPKPGRRALPGKVIINDEGNNNNSSKSSDSLTNVPGEKAEDNCPSHTYLDLGSLVQIPLQLINWEDPGSRSRRKCGSDLPWYSQPCSPRRCLDFSAP